jgi:hypothetical protein
VNDISELTITALRFGFLLLLWVLIFSIVTTMRRDLQIGRKAVTGAPTAREVRKHPELAASPPPAIQHARTLVVTEGPLKGTTVPSLPAPFCLAAPRKPPSSWKTITLRGGMHGCSPKAAVGSSRTSAPLTAPTWPINSSPAPCRLSLASP